MESWKNILSYLSCLSHPLRLSKSFDPQSTSQKLIPVDDIPDNKKVSIGVDMIITSPKSSVASFNSRITTSYTATKNAERIATDILRSRLSPNNSPLLFSLLSDADTATRNRAVITPATAKIIPSIPSERLPITSPRRAGKIPFCNTAINAMPNGLAPRINWQRDKRNPTVKKIRSFVKDRLSDLISFIAESILDLNCETMLFVFFVLLFLLLSPVLSIIFYLSKRIRFIIYLYESKNGRKLLSICVEWTKNCDIVRGCYLTVSKNKIFCDK